MVDVSRATPVARFAVGMVDYSPRTGISFAPVEWYPDIVVIGILLTLVYVIWCALWRWLARRLSRHSTLGNVRTVSNATFLALVLLANHVLATKLTYAATGRIMIQTPADPAAAR
jgi:hypothetical protein